jgi:SAM-dependent methyltransferase
VRAKVANIVNFQSKEKFDCILLLNNVLDQIPLRSRRLKALQNCHKMLNKNGKIIITSHSIFYPGKFGEEWIKTFVMFISFNIKKLLKIPQEELEFGDQFIFERKPIFIHISSPNEIKQLLKESRFKILYFNSKKGIETGRKPNFFTIFEEPLFYIGQK